MNKLTNIQDRTGAWQTWLKFLRLEQKYLDRACVAKNLAPRSGQCGYSRLMDRSLAYWDLHYKYQAMKKEIEQTLTRK